MVIKIKKIKNNEENQMKWRIGSLLIVGFVATLLFTVVIVRLAYIQFVKGEEYSQEAYSKQVQNQIISPNRGTIFDATGEVLAQSISVDTVSINPGKVLYSNNKKVEDKVIAEGFSNIFDITYDEMLKKLDTTNSVVVIQKKVELSKIEELKKWMSEKKITAGINIDEDTKRNYPYNDLASSLIGFCGDDNTGLFGIEERWNDVLTGTAGKIVTATDVKGNAISDEDEEYIPSENGSNIYLTIDTSVQAIAEKYLEQAVNENSCTKGGNVIIMNPQTGDILAMATYPDYNLNEPRSFISTGYTEEEWNVLESADRNAKLFELWKNRAVSGTYEPGSTFKLITAAIGLEEGLVKTDTAGDFFCAGIYTVADYDIKCWRHYEPHGSQTLRDALENSCNPAFMQLGQRIGASTFYKYLEAFGFFNQVGNDIAKAYKGDFHELESIGSVELATTSFGQRFEISPLQLITGISAICNDGVLVEPKIVKKIENTDTKSVQVVETETIRQVISKETADKVKNLMQSVVTDGTGRHAAVTGYSIGGKSGTSEPPVGKEEEGYVASFVSISPIENTQVVVLVTLYDPKGDSHQGGQTAGPVTAQIMSEILPYLGIASTNADTTTETQANLVSVPNVINKTVAEAKQLLTNAGFNVNVNITGDENNVIITDQVPKSGISLEPGAIVCLQTTENDQKNMVQVPNIKGMTATQATNELKSRNLNISIDGTNGIVISQDPTYETEVEEGTVIHVVIKEELKDAQ